MNKTIFIITLTILMTEIPNSYSQVLKSGYYLLTCVEPLASSSGDFVTERSIAVVEAKFKKSYLYLDVENKSLEFHQLGVNAPNKLNENGDGYKLVAGKYSGSLIRAEQGGILILDNEFGNRNIGDPYRAKWKRVENEDKELAEIKIRQEKTRHKNLNFLKKLKAEIAKEEIADYPGIYKNLDDIANFYKPEHIAGYTKWSKVQIKLPLKRLSISNNLYLFDLNKIDRHFSRLDHWYLLSNRDKTDWGKKFNARRTLFKNDEVAWEIFEVKAPRDSVDWNVWKKHNVIYPEQVLHADKNSEIILTNDGDELLATYRAYDEESGVHILALAGAHTDDIKGIWKRYAILRTMNRDNYEGEIFNMEQAMRLTPNKFAKKYGHKLLPELNDSIIESAFAKEDKNFLMQTLKRPWSGSGGMIKFGKKYYSYEIHKGTVAQVFDSVAAKSYEEDKSQKVIKNVQEGIMYMIDDINANSHPEIFYAVPKDDLVYLFKKRATSYSSYPAVILQAAAFFQTMKQINAKDFLPDIPKWFVEKHAFKYEWVERIVNKNGKVQYKVSLKMMSDEYVYIDHPEIGE